ncbi:tol-pal system protein [Paracoccus sp. 1_MG-2023]|uniref:tol-pal system protein n=1 Tax=unclassified Paracoccus (in: a-proteobacteria) TaxID=2688777 RepID=UPI001C094D4E|nr:MULTISPECIES: tol-pal system protein [unclassified Paracoccus (in: a-proteobacteria)]MBU2957527.1 tol-pal system protein [Paracoccus sp. C2R09]MDO6669813.1 tol-pal system protein [Paracoccus sp. 1_MG-2023]
MIRKIALTLFLGLGTPALAQPAPDQATLADLRAELTVLQGNLTTLRAELVGSGTSGIRAAGGASAIDRMNAMEAQLRRLTNQAEQLQNRVGRIAAENERRLADMEFRLCEMEQGCDLSKLTMTAGAGGVTPELLPANPSERPASDPASTEAERSDFESAEAALSEGDHLRAARMFGAVAENHAGGPLTAEALFRRGQAFELAGQPRDAAAAWLEGFAADPDGSRGGASLLGIARVIEGEGDRTASCLYLAEIPARFPGSPEAATALASAERLGCGTADLGALDPLLDTGLDPEAAADMAVHE